MSMLRVLRGMRRIALAAWLLHGAWASNHQIYTTGVVHDRVSGSVIDRLADADGNVLEVLDLKCSGEFAGFTVTPEEIRCERCRGYTMDHEVTYPPEEPYFLLSEKGAEIQLGVVKQGAGPSGEHAAGGRGGLGMEMEMVRISQELKGAFVVVDRLEREVRRGLLGSVTYMDKVRLHNIDASRRLRGFQDAYKPHKKIKYFDELGSIYKQGRHEDTLYFALRYPLGPGEAIEFMMETSFSRKGEAEGGPLDRCFCKEFVERERAFGGLCVRTRRGRGLLGNLVANPRREAQAAFRPGALWRYAGILLLSVLFLRRARPAK